MKRRDFLSAGLAAASVSLTSGVPLAKAQEAVKTDSKSRFKLRYAPSPGQFKNHAGDDILDQLRFMADEGFGAMFDNGLMGRGPGQQEAIAQELAKHDMLLGPFVLYADFGVESFVTGKKEDRDMLVDRVKKGIETAQRAGAKWALVVPGRYSQRMFWDYQTANVIDGLKACAEVCEPSGLVLVIEPLNRQDHPGLFLTTIPQSCQICRAVNSPSCRIVNDLYHQQITEGNLITNIDSAWDEIASFHIGDNPGRKEPGTGEINYRNIFKHLYNKGYKGVLCMEHGTSKGGKEGEKALIEAYRVCDDFYTL